MIKGFLVGAVAAEQCKLPELERNDVEWDCREKFCELKCINGFKSPEEILIRCFCRSECEYIRHYTKYQQNMVFKLEENWLQDWVLLQSVSN